MKKLLCISIALIFLPKVIHAANSGMEPYKNYYATQKLINESPPGIFRAIENNMLESNMDSEKWKKYGDAQIYINWIVQRVDDCREVSANLGAINDKKVRRDIMHLMCEDKDGQMRSLAQCVGQKALEQKKGHDDYHRGLNIMSGFGAVLVGGTGFGIARFLSKQCSTIFGYAVMGVVGGIALPRIIRYMDGTTYSVDRCKDTAFGTAKYFEANKADFNGPGPITATDRTLRAWIGLKSKKYIPDKKKN